MSGYQGQGVVLVTCDQGDTTERTYRLEAAMWADEMGPFIEDETVHDWDTSEHLTGQTLLDLPPGHQETIDMAFEDIQLDE